MIHVVFQQSDIAALRKSFELDKSLSGDILQIKDDFAVGPISNIFSLEGIETRMDWWREILKNGDYQGKVDSGEIDDNKTVYDLKQKLQEDQTIEVWIWAAQNKHDVSLYLNTGE